MDYYMIQQFPKELKLGMQRYLDIMLSKVLFTIAQRGNSSVHQQMNR
jgi:hypothetical protein